MPQTKRRKRTPEELASLVESLGAKGMVAQDFGMRIDSDGQWYHQGGLIKRPALVKLFASILTRLDNGEYWLVTPAERGRIEVDDAPFVITRADITGTGQAREITLYTNLDDAVSLDAEHPLRMAEDGLAARPYVSLGGNLEARINRSVFYDLADLAEEENGRFILWSHGSRFDLGPTEGQEASGAEGAE